MRHLHWSMLAFATTLGLGGVASARDDYDRPSAQRDLSRERVIRVDMGRIFGDGRGESRDFARYEMDRSWMKAQVAQQNNSDRSLFFHQRDAAPLPLKADITNRLTLTDDGADPKASRDGVRQDEGPATRYNPFELNRTPPIPLKTELLIKLAERTSFDGASGTNAQKRIGQTDDDKPLKAAPMMMPKYSSLIGGNNGTGEPSDER